MGNLKAILCSVLRSPAITAWLDGPGAYSNQRTSTYLLGSVQPVGSRAGASFDITTLLASVGRQDPEAQTMDTQSWPGVAMTCLSLGCVCTALGDFQPRQGEGGGLSEIRSTGYGGSIDWLPVSFRTVVP